MSKVITFPAPPHIDGLELADTMMAFSRTLRGYGLPQTEIAAKLGLTERALYNYEHGLYAPRLFEVICIGHLWAERVRQQQSRS
jgi:DNA-binding XRE family transcriptional regulator